MVLPRVDGSGCLSLSGSVGMTLITPNGGCLRFVSLMFCGWSLVACRWADKCWHEVSVVAWRGDAQEGSGYAESSSSYDLVYQQCLSFLKIADTIFAHFRHCKKHPSSMT